MALTGLLSRYTKASSFQFGLSYNGTESQTCVSMKLAGDAVSQTVGVTACN